MFSMAIIKGTANADSLTGTSGNDTIYSYAGADTINGGKGNDALYGGYDNDIYLFEANFGQDYIFDGRGSDIIIFKNLSASDVEFRAGYTGSHSYTDLIINVKGTDDSVKIQHFFKGENPSILYGVERFVFWDGSEIRSSEVFDLLSNTIEGTENNDTIYGSNLDENIQTFGGDDTIYAYRGNDFIDGGQGRDRIISDGGNNTIIGGLGNDYIQTQNGADTISAGAGSDYISAGNGDDTIMAGSEGSMGNDSMMGYVAEDNDSIFGGYGNDTYVYEGNFGQDYIYDSGGSDTLRFNTLSKNDVEFEAERTGSHPYSDLKIKVKGSDDLIEIQHFFRGEDPSINYAIEKFVFDDGTEVLASEVFELLTDTIGGTEGSDIIHGTNLDDNIQALGGNDKVYSYAGNDTIDGGTGFDTIISSSGNNYINGAKGNDYIQTYNGNDTVYGGAGNDNINSGSGSDTLTGGADNDSLYGGNGNDTYMYNAGDGQDVIFDTYGNDTIVFGPDISQSETVFTDKGNSLEITFNGNDSDKLLIQNNNYFIGNYKIENFVFTGPSVEDTIQGSAASETLIGTSKNELILGLGGNDRLFGKGGNDILETGAGNDTIYGGEGADTMRGGAGNDRYIVDNAGDVVSDSAGRDNVLSYTDIDHLFDGIENLQLTGNALNATGNSLNNMMSATSKDNFLSGMGGNDQIFAKAGNDTVVGGAGNDYLYGGSGDDLYLFKAGDGDDFIVDTGSVMQDTIRFDSSVSKENIAFYDRSGALDIKYGEDDITTVYNYKNPANAVENIEVSSGYSADIDAIISHIAAYEATNGVDYTNVDQISNDSQLMNELQVYWT